MLPSKIRHINFCSQMAGSSVYVMERRSGGLSRGTRGSLPRLLSAYGRGISRRDIALGFLPTRSRARSVSLRMWRLDSGVVYPRYHWECVSESSAWTILAWVYKQGWSDIQGLRLDPAIHFEHTATRRLCGHVV